jgi:hypothetical protein
MNSVYNPESEAIAQIERLELAGRDIRRRIEHAVNQADKAVLNKQLEEISVQVGLLRERVNPRKRVVRK